METGTIAYMAGLIDGEGALIIEYNDNVRVRPSFYPRVSITQKDKRILLWVQKHFGGRIDDSSCFCYQWQAPVSGIKQLLTACLPYLILKRRKALLMIALRESIDIHKKDRYAIGHKGLKDLSSEAYKYRQELYDRFYEDDPEAIVSPSAGATTERIDSLKKQRAVVQQALYREMRQSGLHTNEKVESVAEMTTLAQ